MKKSHLTLILYFLIFGLPVCAQSWNPESHTFQWDDDRGMQQGAVAVVFTNGSRLSSDNPRFTTEVDSEDTFTRFRFTDQQKQLTLVLEIETLDEKSVILTLEVTNTSAQSLYLDKIEMLSAQIATAHYPDTIKALITSENWQDSSPIQFLSDVQDTIRSMYTLAIESPTWTGGFLEGKQHFNHFTLQKDTDSNLHLTAWGECNGCELPAGASRRTDPLFISTRDKPLQQLERFADLAAQQNKVESWPRNRAVWCTWYAGWNREKMYSYKEGMAEGIVENIPLIKKHFYGRGARTLRICDDHIAYGDWYDTTRALPMGFAEMARTVTEAGLIAGVWYPTFWASTGSEVFRQHPEWFAMENDGSPYLLKDEFQNRSRLETPHKFLVFDASVPAVQDYFEQVARMWRNKGFRYVTNDFLAFATDPPRYHDPTYSKAQVLRQGMEAVRSGLGDDVFYRTIGAQLGTCMGLSNDVRISGDSHGDKPFAYHRTGALWFYNHRLWINDPSAIVFRRYGELRDKDWNTMWISWIALAGTVMTYGEVLDELPKEYINIYQRVFPPLDKPGRPLDLWENQPYLLWGTNPGEADGAYELFGVFDPEGIGAGKVTLNLDEISARIRGWETPSEAPQKYLVWDFWEKELMSSDKAQLRIPMPVRSGRLFALRAKMGRPQLLATSGHFSMGTLETSDIEWDQNNQVLQGKVQGNGGDPTTLYFHIPKGVVLTAATLNGQPVAPAMKDQILSLQVPATGRWLPFSLSFEGSTSEEIPVRPFKTGRAAAKSVIH